MFGSEFTFTNTNGQPPKCYTSDFGLKTVTQTHLALPEDGSVEWLETLPARLNFLRRDPVLEHPSRAYLHAGKDRPYPG